MDKWNSTADAPILAEIGQRLARRRLDLGLTQAELASEAGISKRTVERLEAGGSTQLTSFVRVLRVLQLLQNLEGLLPLPLPSPMEQLRLKGRQRQRASTKSKTKKGKKWSWGDEP